MVDLLSESLTQSLSDATLTYAEIGATADSDLPIGYRHLTRSRHLTNIDFQAAAEQLGAWQIHERAGLKIASSNATAEPGAVVLMRLGFGIASLRIPCRVIYTVNDANRVGFAYGTLPGHPESGEERFTIERDHAGSVSMHIRAFSKPASLLARTSGPIGRTMQSVMTDRYLTALDAH